ncbi:MAG: hypothetical protein DRP71_05090 [Verrucomicrobia bacterium]|nr:MAG: hypothetical protein DRP71_05090 [Verrucomicrobiota bacterium]
MTFRAEKIMNFIGFSLVAACFVFALVHVIGQSQLASDGRTIVRFTHWQIEPGVREAFEALEHEYERMHPDVNIIQVPIPGRIFVAWRKTQLVGGTPPDLLQLGSKGLDVRDLARFYTPLGEFLTEPNPYNEGTVIEGVPWRQTFLGGLQKKPNYYPELLDVFGIPTSSHTFRIFFNRQLMLEIFGEIRKPATFDEWIEMCRQVETYNATVARRIYPIMMADNSALFLYSRLSYAQTQKLTDEINPVEDFQISHQDFAISYLTGKWTLNDPAIHSGLQAFGEIGKFAKPGFLRLDRSDATFEFIQQRSLFLLTGSWDYKGVVEQCSFDVDAFPIPYPDTEHPYYGPFLKGPLTEIHTVPGSSLGLTKASENPEIAIDFMRYVTSVPGNTLFCRVSGWLPAIIGVDPGETVRDFLPVTKGYPNGIHLFQMGGDLRQVMDRNFHHLFRTDGSVNAFIKAATADYTEAVETEFEKIQKRSRESLIMQSTMMLTRLHLDPDWEDPRTRDELSDLMEGQTWQEGEFLWGNLNRTRFGK